MNAPAPSPFFGIDARVIQTTHVPSAPPDAREHQVLAQRHEVQFRCGHIVTLHPVAVCGVPLTFVRAMQREGLCWQMFDLRLVLPPRKGTELEGDILSLQPRDVPGCVMYTLRLVYPTAAEFRTDVARHLIHQWWRTDIAEAA